MAASTDHAGASTGKTEHDGSLELKRDGDCMSHHLPVFDDDKDKWEAYLVRVEAYFEDPEVALDSRKRALVAVALSTRTVEVLLGRGPPKKPKIMSYGGVVKALNEYCSSKPNEIGKSYEIFNSKVNQLSNSCFALSGFLLVSRLIPQSFKCR